MVGKSGRSRGSRRRVSRHGPLAWFVFVGALAAVLALVAGCLTILYGPGVTGS